MIKAKKYTLAQLANAEEAAKLLCSLSPEKRTTVVMVTNVSPTPEMNIEYACYIASRATSLPVEFFRRLPLKEAAKVKTRVTNFFYAED